MTMASNIEKLLAKIEENTRGGRLPPVTGDDDGKVLAVENGTWAARDNTFVVTCTPTSPDYSGVMDKTVAEIYAAHLAGKNIYFEVPVSEYATVRVALSMLFYNVDAAYPGFVSAFVEVLEGVLISASISFTDDGTENTYTAIMRSISPVT